ncbi:MAG TPA: GspH/FimT family protein [Pseudohaliea sp.]|nr:GspH/FimT family protein [Pseudohaliea sp.]
MRGFTIIDLLLVTGLVALFLCIGLPALRTLHGNSLAAVEHHRILSLLHTARARATAGRRSTVLCPLAAPGQAVACGPAAGEGWLLFGDGNGDRRFQAAKDEVLRIERTRSRNGVRVLDRRGEPFAGVISYRADGSSITPATLQLCASASTHRRRVVISMTGRVRSVREPAPCA